MTEFIIAEVAKFDSPLWGFHFMVPSPIAHLFIQGENRRVICTFKDGHKVQCALMPNGNDEWFITVNKTLRDRYQLQIGDKIKVALEKDDSKYGLPVTEELQELLQQDEEGNALFHALTPGKQRNLLYIAAQVKNPDKRMTRALVIINHLKIHGGKINFKHLNVELRNGITI